MGIQLWLTRIRQEDWVRVEREKADGFDIACIRYNDPLLFSPLDDLADGESVADFRQLAIEDGYWEPLHQTMAQPFGDLAPTARLTAPGEEIHEVGMGEIRYLDAAETAALAQRLKAIPETIIQRRVGRLFDGSNIESDELGWLVGAIAGEFAALREFVAAAADAGEALDWQIS